LLVGLGEALARQSRYPEAISTWRKAIDLYLALSDLGRVARLFARAARAAWWSGNTPLNLALCQEGLQVVSGAPESSDLAFLIHETARAYHFNGVPIPSKILCMQALEMAERLDYVEVQADALTTLGILPDQSPQESIDALKRAIDLAESSGLLIIASRAHTNMGSMVKAYFGDLEGARFHYQRALDIARMRGVVQEELFALETLVGVSLEKGEVQTVEEVLPVLERLIGELTNPASALTIYHFIKSVLYFWQGAWDEALNLMRENRDIVRRSGDLQNLLNINMNFVGTILEKSKFGLGVDWSEAESALEESLTLCERGLGDLNMPLCYYAFVRLEQGKVSEAEAYFSQTSTNGSKQSIIWSQILINWTRAEIAGVKRLWHESDLAFEQAYNLIKQFDQRWFKGRIAIGWAEMLIAQGDPASLERARGLLVESYVSFATMRAPCYLERVEELRRQLHDLSLAQAAVQNEVVQEMAQAKRVQKSFLPEAPPKIAGWDLAAVLEPARETSGDYYDFIPLPGERLGIVIADVADKGAGAALFMASSRTLIRTYAAEYPESPAQVLAAANHRLVVDTHAGLFITLFYAVLDPALGQLIYCNAGHNPPVLFNPDLHQATQWLTKTGMPLGITEDTVWEEEVVVLNSGDVLTLFTDGVTEAQNKAGEFFGEARVQVSIEEFLANQRDTRSSAKSTLDTLLDRVHQFVGSAPRSDDITLMVIRRT